MIDRQRAVFTQHNNVIGNINVMYAIKVSFPPRRLICTPCFAASRGESFQDKGFLIWGMGPFEICFRNCCDLTGHPGVVGMVLIRIVLPC